MSQWIHDFVHSKDERFKGNSKKERIKSALGAYYGAKRHASTEKAKQTRSLRQTFKVDSGKRRHQGPRVEKLEEGKLKNWAIEFEEKFGRKPTNKDLEIKRKREIINHRIKTGDYFYKGDDLDSEGKLRKLKEGLGSPTTALAFSNLMRSKTGSTGSNPDPKEKKKPEKKIKDTGLMASLRKKLYGV